jgi:hypothetical protein
MDELCATQEATMRSNPVVRFEILGPDAQWLRDHCGALCGWSMEVMDAAPQGHVVGLSHGATTV